MGNACIGCDMPRSPARAYQETGSLNSNTHRLPSGRTPSSVAAPPPPGIRVEAPVVVVPSGSLSPNRRLNCIVPTALVSCDTTCVTPAEEAPTPLIVLPSAVSSFVGVRSAPAVALASSEGTTAVSGGLSVAQSCLTCPTLLCVPVSGRAPSTNSSRSAGHRPRRSIAAYEHILDEVKVGILPAVEKPVDPRWRTLQPFQPRCLRHQVL
eukprot:RCo004537